MSVSKQNENILLILLPIVAVIVRGGHLYLYERTFWGNRIYFEGAFKEFSQKLFHSEFFFISQLFDTFTASGRLDESQLFLLFSRSLFFIGASSSAVLFFLVSRKLNIPHIISAILSVAYSLLPFYFHPDHTVLSSMGFYAPLCLWLFFNQYASEKPKIVLSFAALFILGFISSQSVVWLIMVFSIFGAARLINPTLSVQGSNYTVLFFVTIVFSIIILFIFTPYVLDNHGVKIFLYPGVFEYESFALKWILQWFPHNDHYIQAFGSIGCDYSGKFTKYDTDFFWMGIMGVAGLLFLFVEGLKIDNSRINQPVKIIFFLWTISFCLFHLAGAGSIIALFGGVKWLNAFEGVFFLQAIQYLALGLLLERILAYKTFCWRLPVFIVMFFLIIVDFLLIQPSNI